MFVGVPALEQPPYLGAPNVGDPRCRRPAGRSELRPVGLDQRASAQTVQLRPEIVREPGRSFVFGVEPEQEPGLAGVEVEPGRGREALVGEVAVLLARQRAQPRLELVHRGRIARCGEAVAEALVCHGPAERTLLEQPGDEEADGRDAAGDQKDGLQRRRIRGDVRVANRRRQLVDLLGAEMGRKRVCSSGWELRGQV